MDGCVAVQVEDFGLPKSAVGTVGQTSSIFKILPLDFLSRPSQGSLVVRGVRKGRKPAVFGTFGIVRKWSSSAEGLL